MKLFVKAKPGARRERVERVDATHFAVAVRAPAKEGAANRTIEKALAEYLGLPVSRVRVIKGHSSRNKTVEILMRKK